MKKMITIILLTLIATHAMGQVDYNKKTDRFCLNSTLRYRNEKEINKDIIEMFKYAGNQEGKRWWTGYYVPKQEFPDKDASKEAASPNNIEMGKNVVRTMKMKVDKEAYRAIQTLHMLAIYTAVPMDAVSNQLDGTLYYITWSDGRGDFLALSPSGAESATAKQVLHLFNDIAYAVGDQDLKGLQELMPTVNELIAHYRTLLHPDVIVDEKMNLDL